MGLGRSTRVFLEAILCTGATMKTICLAWDSDHFLLRTDPHLFVREAISTLSYSKLSTSYFYI